MQARAERRRSRTVRPTPACPPSVRPPRPRPGVLAVAVVLLVAVILATAAILSPAAPALAEPSTTTGSATAAKPTGGDVIYWSDAGDDANPGLDSSAPVRTWDRVSELLRENTGVDKVALTGTVTLESTEVDPPRQLTITRADGNKQFNMFWVADGATVSFDDVTIDGGVVGDAATYEPGSSGGFIIVQGARSTVTLGGSCVLENNGNSAVVLNGDGATLDVEGATFRNNVAIFGGAIAASYESTVNVDAGTFEGNRGDSMGGAIMLSGGTGAQGESAHQTLNVTGRAGAVTFADNASKDGGGAICLNVGTSADIRSATFRNNNAMLGGAIYVAGNVDTSRGRGTLTMGSTLITGNSASSESDGDPEGYLAGGGIYSCPTSVLSLDVDEGYKIFGNTASDIAIDGDSQPFWGSQLYGAAPSFRISSRAADGTDSAWEKVMGAASDVSAYLDSEVTLQPDGGDRIALRSGNEGGVTDPSAYDVVLTGNSAEVGGAIANNGTLSIGSAGKDVSVTKVWDDAGKSDARPAYITLRLYADDAAEPLATVRIGTEADASAGVVAADVREDGSWGYVFENLPTKTPAGRKITYRVEEDQAAGYLAPVVTGDQASGFTVTNKVEPEGGNPGEPGGGNPGEPGGDNPGEPGGGNPGVGSGAPTRTKATPAQPGGLPDTSDPTSRSAALALAALGLVPAGTCLVVRRKLG